MNKKAQQDITGKLHVFNYAKEPGNIAKAFRYFGISREIFYPIVPLFLRKISPGLLLEKSAKISLQPMPSAAPAVLLYSPRLYVTSLRK